jgi:hypothetical protein
MHICVQSLHKENKDLNQFNLNSQAKVLGIGNRRGVIEMPQEDKFKGHACNAKSFIEKR